MQSTVRMHIVILSFGKLHLTLKCFHTPHPTSIRPRQSKDDFPWREAQRDRLRIYNSCGNEPTLWLVFLHGLNVLHSVPTIEFHRHLVIISSASKTTNFSRHICHIFHGQERVHSDPYLYLPTQSAKNCIVTWQSLCSCSVLILESSPQLWTTSGCPRVIYRDIPT